MVASLDDPEFRLLIALTLIPGLGRRWINKLLDLFGSAQGIWDNVDSILDLKGVRQSVKGGLRAGPLLKEVDSIVSKLKDIDAWACYRGDRFFPSSLENIPDPPLFLLGCGDIFFLHRPSVAIVGSRQATSYGRKIARDIAKELSGSGYTVISGLALGIDTEAHIGALQGMSGTVAVLGCGLDWQYPVRNLKLRERIINQGALVTEYLPGVRPDPAFFPHRNRIISGLSLGIIVVEAGRKSGSLITAAHALEQGKDVFAVPGSVYSYKSSGPHWLIKQGAVLVENASDVLSVLNISGDMDKGSSGELFDFAREVVDCGAEDVKKNITDGILRGLSSDEKRLYEALETYPQHIDELANVIGMSISIVGGLLVQLELKDLVISLPGQMYQLKTT